MSEVYDSSRSLSLEEEEALSVSVSEPSHFQEWELVLDVVFSLSPAVFRPLLHTSQTHRTFKRLRVRDSARD